MSEFNFKKNTTMEQAGVRYSAGADINKLAAEVGSKIPTVLGNPKVTAFFAETAQGLKRAGDSVLAQANIQQQSVVNNKPIVESQSSDTSAAKRLRAK